MFKQVIVVRTDIKMSKGKLAAQVAHAALGAFLEQKNELIKKVWLREGAKKVVLKIESLEELLKIKELAEASKLPNFLVIDAGRTELPEGTVTCLGIGPDYETKIDKITGHLKLL